VLVGAALTADTSSATSARDATVRLLRKGVDAEKDDIVARIVVGDDGGGEFVLATPSFPLCRARHERTPRGVSVASTAPHRDGVGEMTHDAKGECWGRTHPPPTAPPIPC